MKAEACGVLIVRKINWEKKRRFFSFSLSSQYSPTVFSLSLFIQHIEPSVFPGPCNQKSFIIILAFVSSTFARTLQCYYKVVVWLPIIASPFCSHSRAIQSAHRGWTSSTLIRLKGVLQCHPGLFLPLMSPCIWALHSGRSSTG